jgi:hypothetical protein
VKVVTSLFVTQLAKQFEAKMNLQSVLASLSDESIAGVVRLDGKNWMLTDGGNEKQITNSNKIVLCMQHRIINNQSNVMDN